MSMLSPNETKSRWLALALLPAAALLLRGLPSAGLPAWVPFSTSCGAITGLPCIFCGLTRALHFVLEGEFARALYFNWLAFPFVAAAIALYLLLFAEVLTRRNLLARLPRPHLTRRSLGGLLASLLLLWGLQVYLAVSQHKHELLNSAGPLYSLVVHDAEPKPAHYCTVSVRSFPSPPR